MNVSVVHGDCLDVMRGMDEASVDAIVTDPPYGLEFMGKEWDSFKGANDWAKAGDTREWKDRPKGGTDPFGGRDRPRFTAGHPFQVWCQEWATECLRVLKPGGYMLAFGGTRTWHRLAVAVEDAGFEIRDSIGYGYGVLAWCYGSGFPKSRNVSKDERFCQCVPGVRDPATEDAAESAAQVLLDDLRGDSQADGSDLSRLHGLPVDVHPDYAVPSRTQEDLLASVRGEGDQPEQDGQAVTNGSASDGPVRTVRGNAQTVPEPVASQRSGLLFAELPVEGLPADSAGERLRRDGEAGGAAVRAGQPGMEGRGDVQAAEGELRGAALREVPAGVAGDGTDGRLRDGAPAGHGAVDRTDVAADGVREPHQPESTGQPAGEPGTLSEQRGPQAGRGWPVCGRCAKPVIPRGLGTALKPAWEPIVVARKPLVGNVAGNVLAFGTGALNIDACRIEHGADVDLSREQRQHSDTAGFGGSGMKAGHVQPLYSPVGRWPANVVLDETQAHALDQMSGELQADRHKPGQEYGGANIFANPTATPAIFADRNDQPGGASRFFYVAKAPKKERPVVNGVAHATVKPLTLMRWLVRLVTPPGGTVLDPFAGSGTTVEAAILEGFAVIGIERDAEYLPLIDARIARNDPTLDLGDGGAA